jgi:hypothetical protein
MVLILGMRKVVKLCCCCSKNLVLLYWINAFEILAYLSEIHEVVFELWQMHVLSSFYDLVYEIKWGIHEVDLLVSCLDWIVVLLRILWESDDILESCCLNVNWVSWFELVKCCCDELKRIMLIKLMSVEETWDYSFS